VTDTFKRINKNKGLF